MKQIVSVKDLEEMTRNGQDVRSLPGDALLTPSARDYLRDLEGHGSPNGKAGLASNEPLSTKPVTSKSPKNEIEAFFNSPRIHDLKLQICEIGRRLWQRAYVDGNGGNIAIRVGEDIALCTPTLVSKGFMKPDDMCLVDLDGNQLCSGNGKKRTIEILMHLQIMKTLGIPDPRFGLKECELCDNNEWRPGVTCAINADASADRAGSAAPDAEAEARVQMITEQIMARAK